LSHNSSLVTYHTYIRHSYKLVQDASGLYSVNVQPVVEYFLLQNWKPDLTLEAIPDVSLLIRYLLLHITWFCFVLYFFCFFVFCFLFYLMCVVWVFFFFLTSTYIFNDKINYKCESFADIERLNKVLQSVFPKYALFGDNAKVMAEMEKFKV
jgi:hypothetical protein